jgi:hypothetical protein
MKRLIFILLLIGSSSIPLTSCSNECAPVKESLEAVHVQMTDELNRATTAYANAAPADNVAGSKWKLVPIKDAQGGDAYLVSNEPVLDDFYKIKRIWLTIQVNNPNCFDARAVADAQIQLEKF